ncbi:MAG TPA: serine protease, partial [Deferrisomatales bacterium]|nr:serine protease [Deferrisomatales bacterium]
PGQIVRTDPERDLSLVLTTTQPPGYVDLDRARLVVGHGESVYAMGCPAHLGETVRSGRARMPMRRVGSEVLWELELQTLPGSSGSPVFDAAGRLLGMVKGRWRGEDSRGLAIPSETLLRFLSRP